MQALEEIKNGEYEEFDRVEEMRESLFSDEDDEETDYFYSAENQQKILAAIKRLEQGEFVEYSPPLNE